MAEGKRPSFQFYPDDHLAEASLRACSAGARGIWWDMICYMHQGHPYGHLRLNGRVTTDTQLSLMMGGDREVTMQCLNELEQAGVFSRDEDGAIFCRRMVRDEAVRQMRSDCGKAGGSAALGKEYNKPGFVYAMLRQSDRAVKIGASTNPKQRIYRVRLQFPGDEITLLGKMQVDNMGEEEARLHGLFREKANGEWFNLTGEEVTELMGHLGGNRVGDRVGDRQGDGGVTGRVVPKQSLPPSSSSSSSSLEEDEFTHTGERPIGEPAELGPRETFLTGPSEAFQRFYEAYPRKRDPAEAWREWQATVAVLVQRFNTPDAEIEDFLIRRADEYASSPAGGVPPPGQSEDYRPSPAQWMRKGKYEEPFEEWQKPNTKGGGRNDKPHRGGGSRKTRNGPTERTGEPTDFDALFERIVTSKAAGVSPPAA